MSTKTIYKRIALVAVAALGAGVLSVAPANAANNGVAGAAAAPAPLANVLNVATEASITGAAVVVATVEDGATTAGSFNQSLGLLANSTTVDVNSLTSTATMRSDGEIVFYTKTDNDVAATFTIEGGTFGTAVAETGSINNMNASKTSFVTAKATAATQIAISVKPNAGATTMTLSMYKSGALSTPSQDKVNAVQSGATSRGTLIQRYIITVATTSASGVYSAADSFVQAQLSTGLAAPTTNSDVTNSTTIPNSATSVGYVSFDLNDAYDVSLTGKGALVVSATNGAGVALAATPTDYAAAASVTRLTAVSNGATGTVTVARPAAFANKGFSTTVTISWNGAVVGTKSFTFLGEVATVVATPRRIAQMTGSSSDSTDAFRVTYADSAGNTLIGLGTTATTVVSTTTTSVVTGASIGTQGDAVDAAKGTVTCAAATGTYFGGGTAKLQLQHVNSVSGTVVKSNVFDMTCSPNAYSYTASWDKASYTPGSLATLTITFRDRDGDLANSYDTVALSNAITFAGTPSAAPVAGSVTGSGATADRPNSGTGMQGIKTFQFVVGSDLGDFQAVVGVPDVSARSGQANLAVAYKVASTTTGVTNEDVLKAIVSLIASINKQIAALQKALLRR
jgi:hypothetical protein